MSSLIRDGKETLEQGFLSNVIRASEKSGTGTNDCIGRVCKGFVKEVNFGLVLLKTAEFLQVDRGVGLLVVRGRAQRGVFAESRGSSGVTRSSAGKEEWRERMGNQPVPGIWGRCARGGSAPGGSVGREAGDREVALWLHVREDSAARGCRGGEGRAGGFGTTFIQPPSRDGDRDDTNISK